MKTKTIVKIALIAAIYTVTSLLAGYFSYGVPIGPIYVQLRFSEALTLLPVLSPLGIAGVSIGCFLTNLIGMFNGTNILGALDVPFGTFATVLAAFGTYFLRKRSLWLAALPPVIINAIVIGAELAFISEGAYAVNFVMQAISVAVGQIIACYCLGIPLVSFIKKSPSLQKHIFE